MTSNSDIRAVKMIMAERARQVAKGYTPVHDKHHGHVALIDAARAYVVTNGASWPWERESFKPGTRKENLVKGGALFLAAFEQMSDPTNRNLTSDIIARIAEELGHILDNEHDD